MKTISIQATGRKTTGKKDALHLRRAGHVPCELYGGDKNVHFSVEEIPFLKLVNTPNVYESLITVDGTEYRAVLKEVQYHPVTDAPIHADFVQLFADRAVTVKLPVSITGTSPGVRSGGKLNVLARSLSATALPGKLPDGIEVSIEKLNIGDSIRVGDLKLDGVQLLASESSVIVSVSTSRKAMSAAAGEEVAEGEEGAEAEAEAEA